MVQPAIRPLSCALSDDCWSFLSAVDCLDQIIAGTAEEDCPPDPLDDSEAVEILEHAKTHLRARLRAYLIPNQRPTTEQMALGMLKGLAAELDTAGKELERAAWGLKEKGAPQAAGRAHQAGRHACAVAAQVA